MPPNSSSVPLSWDLRSPSSPKSFCTFQAPIDTNNPFESATEQAIIFGTERGTLHFRCYHLNGSGLQHPLESSRSTQPINDKGSSIGSVISIILVATNTFLMLVDDNRGTSASQPGLYVSQLVAMRQGAFQTIPLKTPRMSCATFSSELGIVYASGRQVANLMHETFLKSTSRSFNFATALPLPGVRSGPNAIEITCHSQIVVAAVGAAFYAVSIASGIATKILSFHNASQVHPILIQDIRDMSTDWSALFLGSGRECAVIDLWKDTDSDSVTTSPRHTIQTTSPILSIAPVWPWIALLTSDGLISIRSPACLAITLRIIEVGNRPNDFFALERILPGSSTLACLSYGGECLLITCSSDTKQDLADRIMRLSIDAFGANGFPRSQLAEAVNASFTATSYVGPEANSTARMLLKQYLEAVLGLVDFTSDCKSTWPGCEDMSILSATALLCLVCAHDTTNPSLANRAAKEASNKLGLRFAKENDADVQVCELVVSKMLREATQSIDLLNASPAISSVNKQNKVMAFLEASIWLMRACGRHERAFQILEQKVIPGESGWSTIKYESFAATYLSDLWTSPLGQELVLSLSTTVRLLETNPMLGLSVFMSNHPRSADGWKKLPFRDDPIVNQASRVLRLLKAIKPMNFEDGQSKDEDDDLPLKTGRALATTFLESAIGINTGRPTQRDAFDMLPPDQEAEAIIAKLHDELIYLLLEGIIDERGDNDEGRDSWVGEKYRNKLRKFLRWPLAKVSSERILNSLPDSFLEEKALLLGRLGRHDEALRILYVECESLDLALAYCDSINENKTPKDSCSYLPLIRVALETDPDPSQSSAIQILAIRSNVIDRAAALRLLPKSVSVRAVARPFLIPALVDSESEIRRLTVTSALLKAKYSSLRQKLIDAQVKAQSTLQGVPQLRSLKLGDPLHITKPTKIRPARIAASSFPDVVVIKHFYPRHLIIQAKITNSAPGVDGRSLSNVDFVVAESSDEAIQPITRIPLKVLPFQSTGCSWCVLTANPQRMEIIAMLTCELRYSISAMEPPGIGLAIELNTGRSHVEELQDLEVNASYFK